MLKIAPLAIGLLTAISITPSAQAFTTQPQSRQQTTGELHSQISIGVVFGGQPEYRGYPVYRHRREAERLRRLELERQEARRRQEYYSRRYRGGYWGQSNESRHRGWGQSNESRDHGGYNNGNYRNR